LVENCRRKKRERRSGSRRYFQSVSGSSLALTFAALREFFSVFFFCVFCAFSRLFLASVAFSAFEDLVAKSKRARMAKFGQIDFKEASIGTFSDPEPFDLVVGRYVLIHQADPVDLIRAAAALSRPGGIVAFHELNVPSGMRSFPDVPLWQQVENRLVTAFKSAAPHWDAGARLTEHFSRAGLPIPRLFSETPIGNAEDPHLIALAVNTLRNFMPQLLRLGPSRSRRLISRTSVAG
jgi:SAM-dependent methyltransferase